MILWRPVISGLLLILFPLCGDHIDFHRFENEEAAFTAYLGSDVTVSDSYKQPKIGGQKYLNQELFLSDPAGLTAAAMTLDMPSSMGDYRLLYSLLL